MLLNLLFNKFLDLGAVEVAVVDPTLPHSIKAIQHHTSIETLTKNLLFYEIRNGIKIYLSRKTKQKSTKHSLVKINQLQYSCQIILTKNACSLNIYLKSAWLSNLSSWVLFSKM
jgi:hypothetical protein